MSIPPIKIIIQGIDQFSATIGKSLRGLKQMGKTLSSVGTKMTMGLSLPLTFFGASALQSAGKFQESMLRVQNVTQETGEAMARMSTLARAMGASTRYTAGQAGEAMVFLGQAGFNTEQVMAALPATLDLATMAQLELGDAADQISNIMNGMRIPCEKTSEVVDKMTVATQKTNSNMTQMAEALSYVAPNAVAAGVALDEAATWIGILSNAGIQGARAGTSLRASMNSLLDPTREAIITMNQLGIKRETILNSKGQITSLRNVLEAFSKSGATATDMIRIFGGKMAVGMNSVVAQGLPLFDKLNAAILGSAGAGREAAAAFETALPGQIKEFTSAVEELQIAMLIDTGLMQDIIRNLRKVTVFIRELAKSSPEMLKFAVIFGVVLATIGPVLLVVGQFITMIGVLAMSIASAGGVFALLTSIFNPVTLTILGIIAAIGALVAILKMAGYTWKDIWRLMLIPLTPFVAMVECIIKEWDRLLPFFKLFALGLGAIFKYVISPTIHFFLDPILMVVKAIIKAIKLLFGFGLGGMESITTKLLPEELKQKVGFKGPQTEGAFGGVKSFISSLVGAELGKENVTRVIFDNAPAGMSVERVKGDFDIETSRGTLLPALGG